MFEGGVRGGVSPRLLHVLLPVKLRLLFHGLCICTNKITRQSSQNKKESSVWTWKSLVWIKYLVSMLRKCSSSCQNAAGNYVEYVCVCAACCKSSYVMPLMFLLEARIVHFACGRLIHLRYYVSGLFFHRVCVCVWILGVNLFCLMRGDGRKLSLFW